MPADVVAHASSAPALVALEDGIVRVMDLAAGTVWFKTAAEVGNGVKSGLRQNFVVAGAC
jgi:hypothetical protein